MSLSISNSLLYSTNNTGDINGARQKVSDCQTKVQSSSQTVNEKSNALNLLNSDKAQLSGELTTKQSALTSAQALVESTNALLSSAQSIPVEQITDEEGNVTQDSSARDSAIAQAQQAVNSAKAELQSAQEEYEQTQNEMQQKEQEAAQAQSELDSANTQKSSAEAELTSAQNELAAAEQAASNQNNRNEDDNPLSNNSNSPLAKNEDGGFGVETVTGADESDEDINVNGEIDENYNQHEIGDCGLLSSISALASTQQGAEDIRNSIETTTDENGNTVYNVTFAGIGETYTVSGDEMRNARSNADGRQYSTGDDDMTLLELAVEKCLSQSDDETIETYCGRDESSSEEFGASNTEDDADYLNSVSPNIVSYLFSGDTGSRVFISESNSKQIISDMIQTGSISSSESLTVKDTDGNEFDIKANKEYEIVAQNEDGTIEIKEPNVLCFSGKTHTVSIDELYNSNYMNLKSTDDYLKSAVDEMLDSFDENEDTAVVFANMETSDEGNAAFSEVEDVNGETVELPKNHAYAVTDVTEDTITLANPWNTGEELTFTKDELYSLDNFKFYELAA